ncbi:MAG: UDP-galactopyranose mutase [Sedimentisphaerales bacterium]|nr:UDP-galactopyranose mutase [Sedimentisphaerales bacterium]
MTHDYLIVGAGFAGCVLAERLANGLAKRVLLIDRRDHIGGNAYDEHDGHGLLVQRYGPHIFHTNKKAVWDYLSRFTQWNGYVHHVLANLGTRQVHLPISIETMERLYNRTFTPDEMREYFERRRVRLARIENARDVVVSQVGEELYELLFRNYTRKQWGLDPEQLDAQVTGRLPVRFDRDIRYFSDRWQGLPRDGYTRMFERMLQSPNIEVRLETEYSDLAGSVDREGLIFTGAIDEFFHFKYGRLPYRSLAFRFETLPIERFQNAAVVNYPGQQEYTRITEFKHLYLQEHPQTTVCYECGSEEGPACYPVPTPANHAIYDRYRVEADRLDDTFFVGRLAEYAYLNMDQVVERALDLFRKIRERA